MLNACGFSNFTGALVVSNASVSAFLWNMFGVWLGIQWNVHEYCWFCKNVHNVLIVLTKIIWSTFVAQSCLMALITYWLSHKKCIFLVCGSVVQIEVKLLMMPQISATAILLVSTRWTCSDNISSAVEIMELADEHVQTIFHLQ